MPQTARLFMSGRSQAVRLPKQFRFQGNEVFIRRVGDQIILSPKPANWDDFFNDTQRPTADFMAERVDLPPQERVLF